MGENAFSSIHLSNRKNRSDIMKQCSAVIGSLWGDEGKGHMTDILCDYPNTLNVRFNGGAQASHTVVTPDNKRYAFRHFGSGTFAGAKTYLGPDFIVNPPAFVKERNELKKLFDIIPCEYVNPNCIVTTPWDVYINQGVETLRGSRRHGSCGFGINETVERSKISKYKITVEDLFYRSKLIQKLTAIQKEYFPMRIKTEYGLITEDFPNEYRYLLEDKENIDIFLFYAEEFISNVQIIGNGILNKFDNIVFEGAQGLLLDQNNVEYFPNVTSSNTGIKNVMNILGDLDFKEFIDIYYMSRCYITRHGAGKFRGEIGQEPYSKVVDLTNVPNEFQGALRYGYLNFDLLSLEINKDLRNLKIPANINLTFTCIDQLDDCVKYFSDSEERVTENNQFLRVAQRVLSAKIKNLHNIHYTNGLTRNDYV